MVNAAGYASTKRGGEDYRFDFQIQQSDLIANNTMDFVVPFDGYVTDFVTIVDKTITTGGTLTLKTSNGSTNNPATITNTVAGAVQTIANSAAKGTTQKTVTTSGDIVTTKVSRGDRLQIIPAGFATGGSINGHIRVNSLQANT